MRRLTDQERNAVHFVARQPGQSYCPNDDATAEPGIMKTLESAARKGRLRKEETDVAPRFHLTSLGREEAENG